MVAVRAALHRPVVVLADSCVGVVAAMTAGTVGYAVPVCAEDQDRMLVW